MHVAKEETKYGFTPEELLDFMESGTWREYTNVSIAGLMCMATNTDDASLIASEFEQVSQLFLQIKGKYFPDSSKFRECSWGMSADYPIAVAHGSNMVRIGSLIFGERVY